MGGATPLGFLYIGGIAPERIDVIQESKAVVGRSIVGSFWRHPQKRVRKLKRRQDAVREGALVEPANNIPLPLQPSFPHLTPTSDRSANMANYPIIRVLSTLDSSTAHTFIKPKKKINESQDVSTFLTSKAYTDIMTWVLQLNRSMFPLKVADDTIQTWTLNSDAIQYSAPVRQLQRLLSKLEDIIEEVPPDTGPRRFGNISFRRWSEVVESRASDLLRECLPADLLDRRSSDEGATAETELKSYFLGSWGSGQRLDYGTGHELSFLAFLGGIWRLNGFPNAGPGVEERAIVVGVIHPCVHQESVTPDMLRPLLTVFA